MSLIKINFGSVVEKREQIDEHVSKCFKEARENKIQVHEVDLRRWAYEKAAELGLNEFKGSENWAYKWKKRHGIALRKNNKSEVKKSAILNFCLLQFSTVFFLSGFRQLNNHHTLLNVLP